MYSNVLTYTVADVLYWSTSEASWRMVFDVVCARSRGEKIRALCVKPMPCKASDIHLLTVKF